MNDQNMRFLLVDDDEDDRILFIDALEEIDNSIECLTAVNGHHALEVLREMNPLPDFIFLDLNMPRINGNRCLAELKINEHYKHIPVVIYTTSNDVEAARQLKEMGAVYFISKPKNADEIYYLISFVIEQQKIGIRNPEKL